ncbi:phosphatase PAP2 family protein [Flagellimonas sp. HMM57]|uniref:phosphatase PAP2 family protein n=1 Tax=unclassified Flagellimonas TaxID=2644544 RepID=UPI0013D67166|nr:MULTISPECIES: phosphatase PAP2 family protein [unclassified Flagellimonas]UII74781.1 phosphatase PAP2 family protein [Flagellimonas sp. HMM57]
MWKNRVVIRFRKVVFATIMGLFSLTSSGQFATVEIDAPKKDTQWSTFTYDLGTVFKAVGHSYTRPLHWQGKQWATFAGVIGGTGAVYLIDEPASDYLSDQGEDIPKFLKEYGRTYGSPQVNYAVTGGVYLTGLFTKNEKLRRTGVLLIASATSTGFLQQVLKSAVGRARPVSGQSKDTFDPFNSHRDYHSFPSGHTMLAFTNAYAIAKQFKSPWVKGGIYAVGLVPGLSRLWEDQHWLSDVVLGMAISIFTVESIDKYLDKKYSEKYNRQEKKVQWNLTFAPNQLGVSMNF